MSKKDVPVHIADRFVKVLKEFPWNMGEFEASSPTFVSDYLEGMQNPEYNCFNYFSFTKAWFDSIIKEKAQEDPSIKKYFDLIYKAHNQRAAAEPEWRKRNLPPMEKVKEMAYENALILRCWLQTKQSYRFQKTFYDMLSNTPTEEFYPQVLDNLPFKSFFLNTEGLDETFSNNDIDCEPLYGVFVNIYPAKDKKKGRMYYVELLFCLENGFSMLHTVYYINDGHQVIMDKTNFSDDLRLSAAGNKILNVILYIASQNADIKDSSPTMSTGAMLRLSVHRKEKLVLEHDVGFRIGTNIEKNRNRYIHAMSSNGLGKPVAPHVRAAHWHHFWVGKIGSSHRRKTIKWIEETFVNCSGADEIKTVEHRSVR